MTPELFMKWSMAVLCVVVLAAIVAGVIYAGYRLLTD